MPMKFIECDVRVLSADIINPEKDRRSADWHRAPVIKAGTRFVVSYWSEEVMPGTTIVRADIRIPGTMGGVHAYKHAESGKTLAGTILANSRISTPKTLEEYVQVHDQGRPADEWSLAMFARDCFALGLITPETVEKWAKAERDDEGCVAARV